MLVYCSEKRISKATFFLLYTVTGYFFSQGLSVTLRLSVTFRPDGSVDKSTWPDDIRQDEMLNVEELFQINFLDNITVYLSTFFIVIFSRRKRR